MSESVKLPMPSPGMRWVLSFGFGLLGVVLGGVATYTTQTVLATEDRKQVAIKFDAVDKRFLALDADKISDRAAITLRFEALDRDRDNRTAAGNAKIDSSVGSINQRFDILDRREESRSDRVGALDGRLNRVEAQIPILGSLRR